MSHSRSLLRKEFASLPKYTDLVWLGLSVCWYIDCVDFLSHLLSLSWAGMHWFTGQTCTTCEPPNWIQSPTMEIVYEGFIATCMGLQNQVGGVAKHLENQYMIGGPWAVLGLGGQKLYWSSIKQSSRWNQPNRPVWWEHNPNSFCCRGITLCWDRRVGRTPGRQASSVPHAFNRARNFRAYASLLSIRMAKLFITSRSIVSKTTSSLTWHRWI